MELSEVEELLEKVNRFRKKLLIKEGDGMKSSHTFDDGEIHLYTVDGVRPPEDIKDEIETMFIWLWNLKDYVKKYAVAKGKSKDWVEVKVNADPYLCICADLANSIKHGGLDPNRKSRSGKSPKLDPLTYKIPQNAMGELTFGAFNVDMKVSKPQLVVLEMAVSDANGKIIGDAFKFLDYGFKTWENIASEAEKTV